MTDSGNNFVNTVVGKRAAEPKISPRATLLGELRCNFAYSGEPEQSRIIFGGSRPLSD